MAKQLYDYWFVQFDFPDEHGRPYKSSGGKMVWNEKLKREIPKGWFGENICRIADILSGGTPSKKEASYWNNGTIPFFGPTDYSGNIFQMSTEERITENGLTRCASSLFEEGVIIITARGSIGKLVIVGTPMAMNQSCYALRSKNGEFEYLFFLTSQLIEDLKCKGSGSVFKSITTSDIENSWLCVGADEIVTLFCDKVKPIFGTIKEKTLEVISLTKLRDELLPLLMNGQVSVNYDLAHQTHYEDFSYICSGAALGSGRCGAFLSHHTASNTEKYDSMNIFKSILSTMQEDEPILLVGVRSILFLMFFLIALYLSYDRDMLLFCLTTGGMTVYALLIIGVLFFQRKKKKKKEVA